MAPPIRGNCLRPICDWRTYFWGAHFHASPWANGAAAARNYFTASCAAHAPPPQHADGCISFFLFEFHQRVHACLSWVAPAAAESYDSYRTESDEKLISSSHHICWHRFCIFISLFSATGTHRLLQLSNNPQTIVWLFPCNLAFFWIRHANNKKLCIFTQGFSAMQTVPSHLIFF